MKSRNQKLEIRNELFLYTIKSIKSSFSQDIFILQTINHVDELQKTINTHANRFLEWLGYILPEAIKQSNFEILAKKIIDKTRKELLIELNIKEEESMGFIPQESDYDDLRNLAKLILKLYAEKELQLRYLEKLMTKICPNLLKLSGITIGARLINYAGSLRKLAFIPASKIQLYGAEKALFRHLKTGAKSPKYGIIHEHPFVLKAKEQGKAARVLADKMALAVKVDYFKGEFIADKIIIELEKRFEKW